MKPLPEDELAARLDSLKVGPWTPRAQHALRKLDVNHRTLMALAEQAAVDLAGIALGQRAETYAQSLYGVLRWHGERTVDDAREIRFRDSLDDALTYPQLIELAIETGYLPLDQARHEARRSLLPLLWPDAVRRFIDNYAYISVDYLAARAGLRGLEYRIPPPVDPGAAILFSAFLATYRRLESDELIVGWLDFLDDYVREDREQEKFYDFLQTTGKRPSRRFDALLAGAWEFAVLLADFFRLATQGQKARFGLFYGYWLAKMYGYRLDHGRYVRDTDLWGTEGDCWARTLKGHFETGAADTSSPVPMRDEAALYADAIAVLDDVWIEVRDYVATAREETAFVPQG